MLELAPHSPLKARPGRHGLTTGPAGLTITERTGLAIVGIAARKGQEAALAAAIQQAYGQALPTTPRRVGGDGLAFIWSGPGQWLAIGAPGLADALPKGAASFVDQSDGRIILRLSGPHIRDALAKGLALDLHPRTFAPGHTAISQIAHIGVQIWQIDEDTYDIAAFRGFAQNLFEVLVAMGQEYGVEVRPGE